MSRVDAQLRLRQARAKEHPIRAAILSHLNDGRQLSASVIAHELPGAPAHSVVAYHAKVLLDAGLIRAAGNPAAPVYFAS